MTASSPAAVNPTTSHPPQAAPQAAATSPATPAPKPPLSVQTAKKFLEREFPPKEPLVEGLLYRRDIVAFVGRRRHGKTSILASLATALALPESEFIGYQIHRSFRVLGLFLEDDPRELQQKLRQLMPQGRSDGGRLAMYTREDFQREGILVDLGNDQFKSRIKVICLQHRPDVVLLDNLAHLIGAAYNDSKIIHKVATFVFELTSAHNAAVIIAAHPRKRSAESGDFFKPAANPSLKDNPEAFFENAMGSSHFINSCGSHWGIERNMQTNRTDFVGGAQRFIGQQTLVALEKDDDDCRFRVVDEYQANFPLVTNTEPRRKAWSLLPEAPFTYTEGESAVKPAMRSSSTFSEWFSQLRRMKMVIAGADGRYLKAQAATGAGGK